MNKETMTVHQALCELKILEDRIKRAYTSVAFVYVNQKSNTKISGIDIEKHDEKLKDAFKSTMDLIKRLESIKNAVVLSNATTKVTIGDKEYTVAEAIEMKNARIPILKSVLYKLTTDLQRAVSLFNQEMGKVEERADKNIAETYGASDKKLASDDIVKAREAFIDRFGYEIKDPIHIQDAINKIQDEVDQFVLNVDSALSVSNSLTNITIEY